MTTKKQPITTVKRAAHKRTASTSAKAHGPHLEDRLDDLKMQLGWLVTPDFTSGKDYYPRLDYRLMGKLTALAAQVLDVLETRHAVKPECSCKHCCDHDYVD